MKHKYSYEFLVSLRDTGANPRALSVPEVAASAVNKTGVRKSMLHKKKQLSDTERMVPPPDFLGPDERAKLEEIQRLVRQQKPQAEKSPEKSKAPEEAEAAQRWENIAKSLRYNDSEDTQEKGKDDKKSSLNPNAVPFVPPSVPGALKRSHSEQQECDDSDSSAEPPWGSEIDLPPPPAVTKTRKIETDAWRLKQRQKQIKIGLQTVGYKNYHRAKEIGYKIDVEEPRIPNVYQVCSKRAWDGQIRRWRQLLHKFDDLTSVLWPEAEAKQINSITAKQERFRERVRKQQILAEMRAAALGDESGEGNFNDLPLSRPGKKNRKTPLQCVQVDGTNQWDKWASAFASQPDYMQQLSF